MKYHLIVESVRSGFRVQGFDTPDEDLRLPDYQKKILKEIFKYLPNLPDRPVSYSDEFEDYKIHFSPHRVDVTDSNGVYCLVLIWNP